MITLFVDSDILLDIILLRQPFFGASAEILELPNNNLFKCIASVHSILNVHYSAKKMHGEQTTRLALKTLMEKLSLVAENDTLIHEALDSAFTDFEDAVQYYAAQSADANYIITRNIKDYKHSTIPVLTAEQFLQTL